MAPLVLIGFFTLCIIALLFTAAFVQILVAELALSGRPSIMSLFFGFVTACFWGLVWMFTSFTITMTLTT